MKILKWMTNKKVMVPLREFRMYRRYPNLKQRLKENKKFCNKYEGERCFILGNGPSLNDMDFSLLSDEITFSVNQLPRNQQFEQLNTNFHFWADERFFCLDDTVPHDAEVLKIMKNVNTKNNKPVVFYKYTAYDMVKKYALDQVLDIHYYHELYFSQKDDVMKRKVDFTHFVPKFPTVVQYIICMAVYMGFSEIYLLGCDCTGFLNNAQARLNHSQKLKYGYSMSENEICRMEKVIRNIPIEEELQWSVDIFKTYRELNQYCIANNVFLANATNGGLLDSIPRVSLEDILK